jgi:hypothetical protein
MATNTGIPGLSFSLRRALGFTRLRRLIAKTIGIPTTKAGAERKLGGFIWDIVKKIFK